MIFGSLEVFIFFRFISCASANRIQFNSDKLRSLLKLFLKRGRKLLQLSEVYLRSARSGRLFRVSK